MIDSLRKSDAECITLLKYIFDGAPDFYKGIAPWGFINSEFVFLLHPTPEQQLTEHIRISENLNKLPKKNEAEQKPPDVSEFKQDDLPGVSEFEEFLYLIGLCTYDIFSNNHEVIGRDCKVYDLGSMRGSGSFIAEFLNTSSDNQKKFDYIDFYMGTVWINERGNLVPLYEFVFQKLKENGCDWWYSFPRLMLLDFSKTSNTSDDQTITDYKPEQALQKELESSKKEIQLKKMQDELDKAYKDEYENAKNKPLDQIVQAYKNIFGALPKGHPQKEFE